MSAPRFPILAAHTAPLACFYCRAPVEGAPSHDAGYPPGGGQYRKQCPLCGCRTYYDLETTPQKHPGGAP